MEFTETPFIYAHVENPMLFKISTATPEKVILCVTVLGEPYYLVFYPTYNSSGNNYTIGFDLSSFFKPFFEDKSVMILGYSIALNPENTLYGAAIRGGISKRLFLQLKKIDSEIFSYRLLSSARQFLLTTRTQQNTINLRDSEFRYINFFRDPNYPVTISAPGVANEVFAAGDMQLITFDARQWLGATPASEITITKNTLVCKIKLTAETSENKLLLMFRNSLGIFEHFILTGKGNETTSFESDNISVYDPSYGDFQKFKERSVATEGIEIESGYKGREELNFIKDLIGSDEVYVITDAERIPCRVTTKDLSIPRVITTPQSISLKIEFADEQINYTDDLPVLVESVPPVIDDDLLLTPDGYAVLTYIRV